MYLSKKYVASNNVVNLNTIQYIIRNGNHFDYIILRKVEVGRNRTHDP